MSFRFLHSGDLHLGKRFGAFTGDLPGRLREARHAVIRRIADHARMNGVDTILLAGDTFDTETPAPDVRRQALAEMRDSAPIRWIILPGNHDSLQAAPLWTSIRAEAANNVVLALEARPIDLAPGVTLLPAPCTTRRPGRDLSAWMDEAPVPEGTIRLGLAHGAVQSFSEDGAGQDVIAVDRARRAGLSYLALGDWHGGLAIDPRTRYCGTPEPDRFKHDRPGEALLVTVAGPSAPPDIVALPTATFDWKTLQLDLLAGDDPVALLQAALPEPRDRRQALLRIRATGRTGLDGRTALAAAIAQIRPDFAWLHCDEQALSVDCGTADLARIDQAGALREAAEMLLAEAEDPALAAPARDIARAALERLYALAQASAP